MGAVRSDDLTDTLCTARCGRIAEGWLEDAPYCLSCADDELERTEAVALLGHERHADIFAGRDGQ